MVPKPFELHVPGSDVTDLHRRLEGTRFPDEIPGASWRYGSDLGYMRKLVDYWRARERENQNRGKTN